MCEIMQHVSTVSTRDRTPNDISPSVKYEPMTVTGATIWNILSPALRNCDSIYAFKICYLNNIFDQPTANRETTNILTGLF